MQVFARCGKISGRVLSSHGLYFGETVARCLWDYIWRNASITSFQFVADCLVAIMNGLAYIWVYTNDIHRLVDSIKND